jgi:hypothetical protein
MGFWAKVNAFFGYIGPTAMEMDKKHLKPPIVRSDELLGKWTREDDGGDLMIYGFSMDFLEDNTGFICFWGAGDEEVDEAPIDETHHVFHWQRIGDKTIRIKDAKSEEWRTIEYSITDYTGSYSIKYDRLTEVGYKGSSFSKEGFWDCFEPLLRSKYR